MKVTLPDGSPSSFPTAPPAPMPRARSARASRGRRSGSAAERRPARPRAPLDGRRRDRDRHRRAITDGLWLIRHDAAHVLATAVMELYPGVKISIGPPIEDGFYYDFEFPEGVRSSPRRTSSASRPRCASTSRRTSTFERSDVPVAEAIERFRAEGQDYKVELIEDLVADADPAHRVETVSLYRNGPFTDLCRGPHGPGTKRIKAFKLTSVAGAYWRGDSDRQMLTRVYGTAFLSKDDLEEHLRRLEQARARDHRKLGRELELFMFSELSPGSPFWLPNGTHIWNELTELWRDDERGARLRRGAHADPLRRRALEAVGPLARVPRQHVLHGRGGPARWASSR